MPPRDPISRPAALARLGLGSHADRENDEIGWKPLAAFRDDNQGSLSILVDAGEPVAEMKPHGPLDQVLHEWNRHLRIERGHHLRHLFQHDHGESPMDQVLHHLQSDESAADDDRGAGAPIGDPGANTPGVGNIPHREHARQVHSWQRWPNRRRAWRQDQRVVMLRAAVPGVKVAHDDRARQPVDADDVGIRVHLDIEPFAEHLGRRDQQRLLVSNDVANVVRQSAVREGHVWPAIEDRNLDRLVNAPQSRGTRRASSHAADNQHAASQAGIRSMCLSKFAVMGHLSSSLKMLATMPISPRS